MRTIDNCKNILNYRYKNAFFALLNGWNVTKAIVLTTHEREWRDAVSGLCKGKSFTFYHKRMHTLSALFLTASLQRKSVKLFYKPGFFAYPAQTTSIRYCLAIRIWGRDCAYSIRYNKLEARQVFLFVLMIQSYERSIKPFTSFPLCS
jgi:hypothetical protein